MSEISETQFGIQRIYIKDASFESPNAPAGFKQPFKPKINLEINSKHSNIEENLHEVVLIITVSAKNEADETIYLAEVHQAGIFLLKGMVEDEKARTLGSYCPGHLFPYAREAIDGLVIKGSFPPLSLAPVNFEAVYAEALRQRSNQTIQ